MVCFFYIAVVAIVAVTYCLIDLNYFIRFMSAMLWGKIIQRKRKRLSEEVHTYGFCTTNDVDIFVTHMNNARYLRELDFSRLDYYFRTGLYDAIVSRKANLLQGAAVIRYRKPISIFSFFRVTTKLMYWDEKALYFEHKFISVPDKFVRAIIISKQHFVGLNMSVTELLRIVDPEVQEVAEAPEELQHFLNHNEASSQKLKKSD